MHKNFISLHVSARKLVVNKVKIVNMYLKIDVPYLEIQYFIKTKLNKLTTSRDLYNIKNYVYKK